MILHKGSEGFTYELSEVEQVRVARWIAGGSARIPAYRMAQTRTGKRFVGLLGFIEFRTMEFRPFNAEKIGREPPVFFVMEKVEIGDGEEHDHQAPSW